MPARIVLAILISSAGFAAALGGLPARPSPEHDVTSQELVFQVLGMDRVTVRKDVPFKKTESGELKLDLYFPAGLRQGGRLPAVVFINGVGDQPDSKLKEWGPYRSWGRLIAATGWIAVSAEARGPFRESLPDIRDLFRFLRSNGASFGIDADRIGAWVCSGNVTSGLRFLMEDSDRGVIGAVVYYGTSEPARFRKDLPVLLVRAGRDNANLNRGIDHLAAEAVGAGAPWTLVNAPDSHHAFDVLDETEESRRIIRQTLAFYGEIFSPPPPSGAPSSSARRALAHWFGHDYEKAAAAYADYVKSHADDAVAWLRLGLSQAHIGLTREAGASLEKAVSLGADRPLDLYNVACGYALAGDTEKALVFLERAISSGFSNRQLLTNDEDLAALRSLPRFQALVERVKPPA